MDLRKFDQFGEPYSLNLKGEDKHKTRVGGLCSVVINVLVLAFFVVRVVFMVSREEPRMYQVQQAVNLAEHKSVYNFLDNNFTIGATLVFIYTAPDFSVTNFTSVDPLLFFDFKPML
jgi:hypothetical protein